MVVTGVIRVTGLKAYCVWISPCDHWAATIAGIWMKGSRWLCYICSCHNQDLLSLIQTTLLKIFWPTTASSFSRIWPYSRYPIIEESYFLSSDNFEGQWLCNLVLVSTNHCSPVSTTGHHWKLAVHHYSSPFFIDACSSPLSTNCSLLFYTLRWGQGRPNPHHLKPPPP